MISDGRNILTYLWSGQRRLMPSALSTNIGYEFLISHMRADCNILLMIFGVIFLICEEELYKLWSCSLCKIYDPPISSSLLWQNILLSTLFSNTLNLISSFSSVNEHEITCKLYKIILHCNFLLRWLTISFEFCSFVYCVFFWRIVVL